MQDESEQLLRVIEAAEPRLRAVGAEASARPVLPGGWSSRQVPCRIGAGAPVTLRFLVTDYLRHLLHHLRQLQAAE